MATFRWATGMLLSTAAASMASVAGCTVGDQICTTDSVSTDRDDDCPYGPPGGPAVRTVDVDECKDIAFDMSNCDGATWDAAYAALVDPVQGGCSESFCHDKGDGTGAFNVYIPKDNAQTSFDNLVKWQNTLGQPYIKTGETEAWILCNLNGSLGGQRVMPPGSNLQTQKPNVYGIIEKWALCGMTGPGVGGTTTSSTSTTTGAGGAGGAGGEDGGAGGLGGAGGVGGM
jgi:hypothetical protein